MRAAFIALLLMLCSFPPRAAEPSIADEIAFEDPYTGFRFPVLLAAYKFHGVRRHGQPRLGYSVEYVETAGSTASIIVYDLDQTGIENGTTDPRVQQEFRKIGDAIQALVDQRAYRSVIRDD
ncbi:MAG TPA: hypothetical protein VIT67_12440, partial [Povalibacter sp.]